MEDAWSLVNEGKAFTSEPGEICALMVEFSAALAELQPAGGGNLAMPCSGTCAPWTRCSPDIFLAVYYGESMRRAVSNASE